jgi:hypothetical protein
LGKIINQVESVSNSETQNNEKLVVISTLTQFIKKSKDVTEAKDLKELFKLDDSRRKGFETMFGFDTNPYYEKYKSHLEKVGSVDNLQQKTIRGVALDASSTLYYEK